MHDVATLQRALGAIAPRHAQVLLRRFVDSPDAPSFATLWGLTPAQADLVVWRAACAFDAALQGLEAPKEPSSLEESVRRAGSLSAALAGDASELVRNARFVAALTSLSTERHPLRAALAEAEARAEASPERRRENQLRGAAIVLVLALSAYFYWRNNQPTPPRFEPRQVAPK